MLEIVFGEIDLHGSKAQLDESLKAFEENQYKNVCRLEYLKIYNLALYCLKFVSCFFSHLMSLDVCLLADIKDISLSKQVSLDFPPSLEALKISFDLSNFFNVQNSPVSSILISCSLLLLKKLQIHADYQLMREGLDWESFFENIPLNFPSVQSFAFKFDNGSRNLFRLLLQKLTTLKNFTSLSLNLFKSESC